MIFLYAEYVLNRDAEESWAGTWGLERDSRCLCIDPKLCGSGVCVDRTRSGDNYFKWFGHESWGHRDYAPCGLDQSVRSLYTLEISAWTIQSICHNSWTFQHTSQNHTASGMCTSTSSFSLDLESWPSSPWHHGSKLNSAKKSFSKLFYIIFQFSFMEIH